MVAAVGAEQIYNFCSGPAMLPPEVMLTAQAEMLDYNGSGMSVMSLSHRSEEFLGIQADAEARLRQLLSMPDNYRVLFLQGGASSQFAAVPLNLMGSDQPAVYLDSGYWSQKAIAEARRYGRVVIAGSSAESQYCSALSSNDYQIDPGAAYLHYTPNETIDGNCFDHIPSAGCVPLVADMSSCILSEPVDVSEYGVIYAGAQKNIGPAGLVVVIVRDDLVGRARADCPRLLNYQTLAEQNSMANTPPTFAIYMAGLVFRWLQEQGGLQDVKKRNVAKAQLLYDVIDNSRLFSNQVVSSNRSLMNVPFSSGNSVLDAEFAQTAAANGLKNLQGHRSKGGLRASIYNAMPYSGVEALVNFIEKFESQHV